MNTGKQQAYSLPPRLAQVVRHVKIWGCVAVLAVVLMIQGTRSAPAQTCESVFTVSYAVAGIIGTHAVGINTLFAPPGGPFPQLLKIITTQYMYLVGGTDGITVSLPGVTQTAGGIPIDFTIPGLSQVDGFLTAIGLPSMTEMIDTGLGVDLNTFSGQAEIPLMVGGLGYMDQTMRMRLDQFWFDLVSALQAMAAQINASDINTARMLGSVNDASNTNVASLLHQFDESEQKLDRNVTAEACRFDTFAPAITAGDSVSRAISNAFGERFGAASGNALGSIGETGAGQYSERRFREYLYVFCDPNSNGGRAACKEEGIIPNGHIMPSRTLFAKETIDMSQPAQMIAVENLVGNITGYKPTEPLTVEALQTSSGVGQRLSNRMYSAQMDAVQGIITGIIGERTPALSDPGVAANVQDMRIRGGALGAAPVPSKKEVRQAVVEQLQNPNFYVELGDANKTQANKEAFLATYKTHMLMDMIDKQERISTAYAIESANLLQQKSAAVADEK